MDIQLRNISNIVVIGGGPAGSFFAHFALKLAKNHGRRVVITILDGKEFIQKGPIGCNMCAGVLSETLINKMAREGIILPETHIQREIEGYYFQTQDSGIRLYHPVPGHKPRIITVYRGNGPRFLEMTANISFDDYLLRRVASQGVKVISAVVEEVEMPEDPRDFVNIIYREGGVRKKMSADIAVGAFGLNTALIKRIVGKKFGYREPQSVRTCNAELHLGRSYIQERFNKTIYAFALGIRPIKFAAIIPKGDAVTVSLVGDEDITRNHLIEFLKHPRVSELLPHGWSVPKNICICFPKIPVTHAQHPYSNRFVIIGDASISRTYKNGIESAFDTAELAAHTVFERGISAKDFKEGYHKPALRLLARDNFYAKLLFSINNIITSRRELVNIQIEHLIKKAEAWESVQINDILWNMVTGNATYREIFLKVLNVRLCLTMFPYIFFAFLKQAYDNFRRCKELPVGGRPGDKKLSELGPLKDGQAVVIIGGGPAGTSCGITLKRLAKERNIDLNVILFEMKDFETVVEHNECAGVLSPPIEKIMEDKLKIPFPWHLVKREIPGYYLHTDDTKIKLDGDGEVSHAVRRVQFDAYLLQKAKEAGITVIRSKVTDVEIDKGKVTVYSELKHVRADVVVGAFGLEEGTNKIFESETPYKSPRFLLTILTKFHPKGKYHDLEDTDGYIHAFLPSLKEIEFGAITPKADHYTINIAGAKISSRSMDTFLRLPNVQAVLPGNFKEYLDKLDYHRGCFPIKPAKHVYGDRYVTIGDAAGLIRPFKGKGVNAACLTGIKAAEVMMDVGISRKAFKTYIKGFSDVMRDLPYARAARRFVIWGAYYGFLSSIFRIAEVHPVCKRALFDSVSGRKTYREILLGTLSVSLSFKMIMVILRWFSMTLLGRKRRVV